MPLRNGPKRGRHFPHGSADWKASYRMRRILDGFNGYAKDPTDAGIANAAHRRTRGNSFAYLASAMALVRK
ncbi:hypothetical protein QMG61_16760 [Cryobacterium sp. PH31-AA6]|uniref:hypothetical protein n=1 Tax=Cryobacterium sp. PH31-AA6 TaxID=3046205 RepID=UPI0024BA23D3|nr:hypothetical protein [Cryobacterium sp. PH31-AA6]MDJ0325413.1 hypothetical protein [Cryobacterium sp. PH31-AA6]